MPLGRPIDLKAPPRRLTSPAHAQMPSPLHGSYGGSQYTISFFSITFFFLITALHKPCINSFEGSTSYSFLSD